MTQIDRKTLERLVQMQMEEPFAAAERVADIAKIPDDRRKAFCDEVAELITLTSSDALNPGLLQVMGQECQFKELEAAIHAVRRAFGRLSSEAQYFFLAEVSFAYYVEVEAVEGQKNPPEDLRSLEDFRSKVRAGARRTAFTLRAMALAAAKMANKDPNRKDGEGGSQNWVLKKLVQGLWRCADKHGGELRATCKNNIGSGSMFPAVKTLQPCFMLSSFGLGTDLIRPVLPEQTIANIVAAERRRVAAERRRPG